MPKEDIHYGTTVFLIVEKHNDSRNSKMMSSNRGYLLCQLPTFTVEMIFYTIKQDTTRCEVKYGFIVWHRAAYCWENHLV